MTKQLGRPAAGCRAAIRGIRLAGVLASMSVAVGNSVSLIVRKRTANTDQAHLADMLAADGKNVSG